MFKIKVKGMFLPITFDNAQEARVYGERNIEKGVRFFVYRSEEENHVLISYGRKE